MLGLQYIVLGISIPKQVSILLKIRKPNQIVQDAALISGYGWLLPLYLGYFSVRNTNTTAYTSKPYFGLFYWLFYYKNVPTNEL